MFVETFPKCWMRHSDVKEFQVHEKRGFVISSGGVATHFDFESKGAAEEWAHALLAVMNSLTKIFPVEQL